MKTKVFIVMTALFAAAVLCSCQKFAPSFDERASAMLEAKGNVAVEKEHFPEKITKWLKSQSVSERLLFAAKRTDGSFVFVTRNEGIGCLYETDANENVIRLVASTDGREAEYDERGNLIHSKYTDGDEFWYEYDDKGNKIYYKDNEGTENWFEYDDNGNKIYEKTHFGTERWYEYDDKGNEIYLKSNYGFESWSEYDDNENKVHFKTNDGTERWYEYDDKGNEIYLKNNFGIESWAEYDDYGNKIYKKTHFGTEYWYEYDDNGNRIYYKNNEGTECWSEYDNNWNEIHRKYSDASEYWYKYDGNWNKVYQKWSDGDTGWKEIFYDENGNEIKIKWNDVKSGDTFVATRRYDNVRKEPMDKTTRCVYSNTKIVGTKKSVEMWYTYSDEDNWDEINFVTETKYKVKGGGAWYITANDKQVDNIYGSGTLHFEKLPSGKIRVYNSNGDAYNLD